MNNQEYLNLLKIKKKYDNIKVNGNYSDKISRLKSRIKSLLQQKEKLINFLEDYKIYNAALNDILDKIIKENEKNGD